MVGIVIQFYTQSKMLSSVLTLAPAQVLTSVVKLAHQPFDFAQESSLILQLRITNHQLPTCSSTLPLNSSHLQAVRNVDMPSVHLASSKTVRSSCAMKR